MDTLMSVFKFSVLKCIFIRNPLQCFHCEVVCREVWARPQEVIVKDGGCGDQVNKCIWETQRINQVLVLDRIIIVEEKVGRDDSIKLNLVGFCHVQLLRRRYHSHEWASVQRTKFGCKKIKNLVFKHLCLLSLSMHIY